MHGSVSRRGPAQTQLSGEQARSPAAQVPLSAFHGLTEAEGHPLLDFAAAAVTDPTARGNPNITHTPFLEVGSQPSASPSHTEEPMGPNSL